MVMEERVHSPVMLAEVLEYLNPRPGQLIVDATLGMGGHSREILKRIAPGGRLIGIDRDEESLAQARSNLSDYASSCEFAYGNFSDLDTILKNLNIESIDGIVMDLGLSSFQLKDAQRGFSFQVEGPLDMRFDRNSYISAYDLVNNLNEEEISHLLWTFGEERWHNRIARCLVQERQKHPIATTQELSTIVLRAIPGRFRHGHHRIHPATRTFQAVRIAVNRELESLETALQKTIRLLGGGARICVISFHSLEDRMVKHTFRRIAAEGAIKIITPKPLTPTLAEIKENPPSRSSKLRVAEKV
jgi:16S rRNA (cytosine1402-N4)-methyltransferase